MTVRPDANPWDQYAPFYDWENRRTMGLSDLAFWRRVTSRAAGPVLELGCGTGRIGIPLAASGVELVGVDGSMSMLRRARARLRRAASLPRLRLVRSDIRALPFGLASFQTVIAPYGVLQSMSGPADLAAALRSAAGVMKPGGSLWIDVAMDVPRWPEYRGRVRWRGGRGSGPTLVESVRQDRRRRFTIFRQVYTQRRKRGTLTRDFELCFYTPTLAQLRAQLTRAGFVVERLYGDYDRGPWHARSVALIIRARRTRA